MINFIEDRCSNYQHRTYINVDQAEVTLIFAIDFSSAGEKCTLNACRNCERPVFMFKINAGGFLSPDENGPTLEICKKYLKDNNISSLNIAGNGIYTFNKYHISQNRLNELITNLIKHLIQSGCDIKSIRSGGQTGADEAGLMAGENLNLETTCLCTKGWKFKDASKQDICSEELFKRRFNK